jgi:hypothetical protein
MHHDLSTSEADEARDPAATPLGRVAGALALVGLIAVAARGGPIWQSIRLGPTDRREILIDIVPVVSIGVLVAMLIAALVHRTVTHDRSGGGSLRRTVGSTLTITSVALAALTLATIAGSDRRVMASAGAGDAILPVGELPGVDRPFGTITDEREGLLAGEDRREEASGAQPAVRNALDPRLLVPLLLAAITTVAILARRRQHPERSRKTAVEDGPGAGLDEIRDAVGDTIEAMLTDPDPQRAVIGAYARLLEALSASGVRRQEHEAPLEHLRRVLAGLRVRPRPLRQLIELFEIARFSTRPLTAQHREQALTCLRSAATDLTAEAPTKSGAVGAGKRGAAG